MTTRRVLGLILALVLLTSCVTPVTQHVATTRGLVLTPEESAEVATIETALLRVCASFKPSECNPKYLPSVTVRDNGHTTPALYDTQNHRIWIDRVFLGQPAFRPVVAHEIAHAVYQEANARYCHSILQPIQCEIAANRWGVHVLEIGWKYDHPTAVTMMYRLLRASAANPKHVNRRGHDACRELVEFQRQLGVTNELPETCQGKAS